MSKWVEISYKDGWFPEGTKCILTNACANEQWAREKYAIFGLDSNPHVAFWPTTPIVLTKRELSKEEAYKAMCCAINGASLEADFHLTYKN